jgi:hypothetical protein
MEEIMEALVKRAYENPKFQPDYVLIGIRQLVKMMFDGDFVSENLGYQVDVREEKTRNEIFDQFLAGEMYVYTDFGKLQMISVNLPSFLGFA